VPQNLFLNDGARVRFACGIRPIDARVGIGLAVRNGISRPDIFSPEALLRTLLAAAAKELRSNRPSADRLRVARARRWRLASEPHQS
jgi:hypothetical protein